MSNPTVTTKQGDAKQDVSLLDLYCRSKSSNTLWKRQKNTRI